MSEAGWFKNKVGKFKALIEALKDNPVWSVTFAGIALIGGFVANDLYGYARNQIIGSDDNYIAELADQQKKEFSALKEQLSSIQSSLSGEARDKFYEIKDSFQRMQDVNQSLIDQLSVAREENKKLVKLTELKTNVSGGYDYILSKNNALIIDDATSFTINRVSTASMNPVNATLNTIAEQNIQLGLNIGESHSFKNSKNANCRITILAARYEAGTVTISLTCKP